MFIIISRKKKKRIKITLKNVKKFFIILFLQIIPIGLTLIILFMILVEKIN